MLFTSRYSSCCDKNNNDLLRELSPLRNRKIHLKLTAPLPPLNLLTNHHHDASADHLHNIHNEVDHEHEIQALESSIESVYASFDGSEDVEPVYSGSDEDEVSYNVIDDDSLEQLDRSRYSSSFCCLLSSLLV